MSLIDFLYYFDIMTDLLFTGLILIFIGTKPSCAGIPHIPTCRILNKTLNKTPCLKDRLYCEGYIVP